MANIFSVSKRTAIMLRDSQYEPARFLDIYPNDSNTMAYLCYDDIWFALREDTKDAHDPEQRKLLEEVATKFLRANPRACVREIDDWSEIPKHLMEDSGRSSVHFNRDDREPSATTILMVSCLIGIGIATVAFICVQYFIN